MIPDLDRLEAPLSSDPNHGLDPRRWFLGFDMCRRHLLSFSGFDSQGIQGWGLSPQLGARSRMPSLSTMQNHSLKPYEVNSAAMELWFCYCLISPDCRFLQATPSSDPVAVSPLGPSAEETSSGTEVDNMDVMETGQWMSDLTQISSPAPGAADGTRSEPALPPAQQLT